MLKLEAEEKKEGNDNEMEEEGDNGTNAKTGDSNGNVKKWKSTLFVCLMWASFVMAISGVIVWTNYPDNGRCYYFYALTGLLSPQLFLLGLLHYAHRAQTKILSSFLTRWQSRQQQLAKIILGAILSLGNFSFTALQLHFLLGQRAWPDEETNNADYGLRISGLIITLCLALPWPLFMLWPTTNNNDKYQCKETQEQSKKRIKILQDPISSSSFKIHAPTTASHPPPCSINDSAPPTYNSSNDSATPTYDSDKDSAPPNFTSTKSVLASPV